MGLHAPLSDRDGAARSSKRYRVAVGAPRGQRIASAGTRRYGGCCMRRALGIAWLVVVGCASTAPSASGRSGAAPPAETAKAPDASVSTSCSGSPSAERVEVALGQTAAADSGVAVTLRSISHDSYEHGHTDLLLHLEFRSVLDGGELSPSALGWMPSAFAKPEWTYLAIARCVRVVEAGWDRVVLEVYQP